MAPWAKNVDYIDLSIPKAHPVDVESDLGLATEIRDRIRASDVFLVFAAMYVNHSAWVKFEIDMAFADSCPIIAMAPNGQERLARSATRFAWRQVNWRGDSVRSAIWDLLPQERRDEIAATRCPRAGLLTSAEVFYGQAKPPVSIYDVLGVARPPDGWR